MLRRLNPENLTGYLLALLAFVMALKQINDLDYWWHLAAGRWMIQNKSFITKDTLSYTFPGAPWVDITWSFEVIAYLLHQLSRSFWPFSILMAALSGLTVFLIWRISRGLQPEISLPARLGTFLIALFVLSIGDLRWIHRPEQLSHFYGALVLLLLSRDWTRFKNLLPSRREIWLIPLIQLFWVNSHGLFWLGLGLPGFFIVAKQFERVRETNFKAFFDIRSEPLVRVVLVSAGACLINPRGFTGASFPVHLWHVLNHPFYRTTIPEATAPLKDAIWGFDTWALVIYSSIALAFFPYRSWRRYGLAYPLLFVILFWFSTIARRNIPLLVLWTAPWVMASVARRLSRWQLAIRPSFQKTLQWTPATLLAVLIPLMITNLARPSASGTRFGGIVGLTQPHAAARLLRKLPSLPRFFAGVQFSDYMLYQVPGYQSYLDGRFAEMYPREHFQRYMEILAHPHLIDEEVKKHKIGAIGLETANPMTHGLIRMLATRTDWQTVLYDETCVVFLHQEAIAELAKRGWNPEPFADLSREALIRARGVDSALGEVFANLREEDDQGNRVASLASTELLLNKIERAETTLGVAASLQPKSSMVILLQCMQKYLAVADREKADLTPAEHACRKAVANNPRQAATLQALGIIYLRSGRGGQGVRYLKKAVENDPTSYEAKLLYAKALASGGGSVTETEAAFLEAARLRPFTADAIQSLSDYLDQRGDHRGARRYRALVQNAAK